MAAVAADYQTLKFKHIIVNKDECSINTKTNSISFETAVGIYSIGAIKIERTNGDHKHAALVNMKILRFEMRIIYQDESKIFKSDTNFLTVEMKNELANIGKGSILAFEGILCGFDIGDSRNLLPLIYFIN